MPVNAHPAHRPTARAARRRYLAASVAFAGALLAAGCGDDGDDDLDASAAQLGAGPDASGLLGLEVTAVGEVTEVVANNAFRMDKNGLQPGVPDDLTPPSPGESPAYTDLGELHEETFTRGDEEFALGAEQEQALVLVPGADLDLQAGDRVQVSGTVRSLDAEAIEQVYEVEIDTDAYAPYLNQLVVVAETVSGVPPLTDG